MSESVSDFLGYRAAASQLKIPCNMEKIFLFLYYVKSASYGKHIKTKTLKVIKVSKDR